MKPYRMLKPDFAAFQKLEAAGRLAIFTVRADERLVGYANYFISPTLRYGKNVLMAANDLWYLAPEYRRGTIAAQMLACAEDGLRKRGCLLVLHTDPLQRSIAPLFQRLGYTAIETIFEKVLK